MSAFSSLGGPSQGLAHKPTAMARGLGVFSVALGLPQVLAPAYVNRLIGAPNTATSRTLMRLVGARELAVAIGLLTRFKPVRFLDARVAGDAMDLALLTTASRQKKSNTTRLSAATASVVGVAIADVIANRKNRRSTIEPEERQFPLKARTAITINRPVDEVYAYWHNFEQLPTFMYHLESVTNTGAGHSHWKARAPMGRTVEWDAEIVKDDANQVIAWHSLPGADVDNTGSVRFQPAPADQGTEVIVEIDYSLPGGALGALAAKMFGEDPEQQIKDDLRRFKQIMETGEVLRSDGSPEGTVSRRQWIQRDAQPSEENS